MDDKSVILLTGAIQSLAWIGFSLWILNEFREKIDLLISALIARIQSGAKLTTPFGTLENVPQNLNTGNPDAVTSDSSRSINTSDHIKSILERKEYPKTIVEDLFLVHESKIVREKKGKIKGLYVVRIWLEAYDILEIHKIKRISYRLYNDDFPQSVLSTEDSASNFDIWINVYGEFTIIAYVELNNGDCVWLTRFLDLPGRPED